MRGGVKYECSCGPRAVAGRGRRVTLSCVVIVAKKR